MSCGRTDLPYISNGVATIHQVTVDLDGTIAQGVWPVRRQIGEPISEGVAILKHYAELGYSICIYTARPWGDAPLIWEWVYKHDLPVDKVWCEKPPASLYIDDRAYNPWGMKKGRKK
jgi:hypothetical protein